MLHKALVILGFDAFIDSSHALFAFSGVLNLLNCIFFLDKNTYYEIVDVKDFFSCNHGF